MESFISAHFSDSENPKNPLSTLDVKSNLALQATEEYHSAHHPIEPNNKTGDSRKRLRSESNEGYWSKEKRHDTDPFFDSPRRDYRNPDIAKQSEDSFDRFLVMRPIDPTDNLTTLSIVKLGNQLKKIGVKPINVTNMNNQLTIQVSNYQETVNLLKCTYICNISVVVEPHSRLNNSKAVIKCPEIKHCTDKDLVEEIQT